MVIAISLIISVLFGWLGFRKGVFVMAASLFNLLIAIYAGVLSTPLVLKTSPGLEQSGYYAAFCMLFLTVGGFVLLEGICFYFFLRGADLVFPALFDKLGGGVLGLAGGLILTGLIFLTVCMMPFSRLDVLQDYLPRQAMESYAAGTVDKVCHFVATWSLEYLEDKPEETVAYLFNLGQEPKREPARPLEIKPAVPDRHEAESISSTPASGPDEPEL